ncbi:MAG: FG-GAP repeat domain-containing protein, partial [Promethearchaeota archaeon]
MIGVLGFILVSSILIIIFWLNMSNFFNSDSGITYIKHSILGPPDATYISYSDIDQDGDIDLLGTSYHDSIFCWWENSGNGQFSYHLISNSLGEASNLEAADMDQDGDV